MNGKADSLVLAKSLALVPRTGAFKSRIHDKDAADPEASSKSEAELFDETVNGNVR